MQSVINVWGLMHQTPQANPGVTCGENAVDAVVRIAELMGYRSTSGAGLDASPPVDGSGNIAQLSARPAGHGCGLLSTTGRA